MGLGIGSKSSYDYCPYRSYDSPYYSYRDETTKTVAPPNPNPLNFSIIRSLQNGKMLIVEIHYPDCKNYEGKKILVYKDITITKLKKQKAIDPHFSENKNFYSPIARFEPTERGWLMARLFVNEFNKLTNF